MLSPIDIKNKKAKGEKVSMITAYDYAFAQMAEAAGGAAVGMSGGKVCPSWERRERSCQVCFQKFQKTQGLL